MWWMGLIQAGVGIAQTIIAANQETTPMKRYITAPESKVAGQMALRTAQEGASREDRAQFNLDLARRDAATMQMFKNSGLTSAGTAATNIMGIDAINQFAARNSDIKRQGEAAYTNWAQNVQNTSDKNVAQNNQLAIMEAQAKGGAIQAGIGNIVGGINTGSNAMLASKSIDTYGKIAENAKSDMSSTLTPTRIGGYGGGNYPAQFQSQTPAPAYQPSQNFSKNFPNALGQVPSAINGVPNPYAQFMFPGGQPAYQSSFGSQGFGAASMPEEEW